MILGLRFINFDVFDDDGCGVLLDDYKNSSVDKHSSKKRLMNLNALIGRNMTGKTSFMNVMSFIKECVTDNAAKASTSSNRPGFSNMVIDKSKPSEFALFFKIKSPLDSKAIYVQYELSIMANEHGSPYVLGERVISSEKSEGTFKSEIVLDLMKGKGKIYDGEKYIDTEIADEHESALSIYGSLKQFTILYALYREISRWFFCRFSSENKSTYFEDGNAPGGHKHLNSTGSNVRNVLEYMKMDNERQFTHVLNEINELIPSMKRKKTLPVSLEASPDKLFLYLLLLRDSDPHSTIFIETPDKDLYHDMVDVLASEMRDFSIRNPFSQIIFTTHNPYIIESMSPREVWIFKRRFEKEIGDIAIECAGDDNLVEAMFKQGVGMGAIWYAGHLDEAGGGSNDGDHIGFSQQNKEDGREGTNEN